MTEEPQFDYIIVGAGSAGCALAARLSENGSRSILLVEAGGSDKNIWLHIPLGVGKLLTNPRYAWTFESEPQSGLQGQRIYSPRGKVLGGSSSLNGMAYVWGDPAEYNRWPDLGCLGWSFADIHPYFKRLENYSYNDDPNRGHDGPMRITDRKWSDTDPLTDAFIEGCRLVGIPETPDYNAGSYEGVRYLEQTAWHGKRWSAATAYLRKARNRKNLKIVTDATVTRVLIEDRKATGIEYKKNGSLRHAKARCEVLICAGAINSPQILELSGVGDAARLNMLGIEIKQNLPMVGENLVDHLQIRCTYETTLPITINDIMRSPWIRMKVGAQYLMTRRGLMAGTSSTAHAITRTRPGLPAPDTMVRIYHISGKDRYSRSVGAGLDRYSGFSIGGFKLYPNSRGSSHAVAQDACIYPKIEPNYLTHPADIEDAVPLLNLIRSIAAQPTLSKFIIAERRPGPDLRDFDSLLDYARACGQTAWHSVGTCRIGSKENGVVDHRLRVHGIKGLRVVDASIMPTLATSNTNAACLMIGERGADFVTEENRL